uniref:non-specific serine/threonine protein kinase n=1 Tax=Nannospalax galili TaxID=1026970 RepID=A0A8C6RJP6_NANGA
MRGNSRSKSDQRTFTEQSRECVDNGYLLSSKIGSGAFSKVYLAYATHECMKHNPKLSSDLQGKHHTMLRHVAIKIVSMAEARVEFSRKFLPRGISSLNATYKHLNVVACDLLEHINAMADLCCCPGLEEEEARQLFWQPVSAVVHCHNVGTGFLKLTDFGFANRMRLKNSLLSTFCGSMAYTAPDILMSKKYNGEQANLWSLGVGIILHAMVSGKLPFKEHQPHCMLHMMHCGPMFWPGLSPVCRELIRGLLQLHPCARLGLQQVAAHCWMLPAKHTLSLVLGATSEQEASQSAISLDKTEPGTNVVYRRTSPRRMSLVQLSGPWKPVPEE